MNYLNRPVYWAIENSISRVVSDAVGRTVSGDVFEPVQVEALDLLQSMGRAP